MTLVTERNIKIKIQQKNDWAMLEMLGYNFSLKNYMVS